MKITLDKFSYLLPPPPYLSMCPQHLCVSLRGPVGLLKIEREHRVLLIAHRHPNLKFTREQRAPTRALSEIGTLRPLSIEGAEPGSKPSRNRWYRAVGTKPSEPDTFERRTIGGPGPISQRVRSPAQNRVEIAGTERLLPSPRKPTHLNGAPSGVRPRYPKRWLLRVETAYDG